MKKKGGCNRKVPGSYTVEAALIVPIVLGCVLFVLSKAITCYKEVTNDTVYSEWWENFEPIQQFRNIEIINTVSEYGKEG